MPGIFHTVSLPVRPFAPRHLSWPPQSPLIARTYTLDCTDWLADAGTVIEPPPYVLVDDTLQAGGVACDGRTVSVTVTGGVPGTWPVIAFSLPLKNGDREDVNVTVPIAALSPSVPPGAIAIGSEPLTLAHRPVDVSQMVEPPDGVQLGDLVLLYRPGPPAAMHLLPANSLGGAATGGVTAASLTLLLSSLPTTLPARPGQLWWNGGTLSLS